MASIMKLLRRIGGAKAVPTSGDEGQLAVWKAGTTPTDAVSLYFHDGGQWVELIDTQGRTLKHPITSSEIAPMTPTAGDFWFRPSTKALSVWDGAQWSNVAFTNVANTFTQPQIINANAATPALRVTQTGAGHALLVEDDANPDASPFVIDNAGKVGIGTATPKEVLTINGSVSLLASYTVIQNNLYYSGGWKYIANGPGWGVGLNYAAASDGLVFVAVPNNTAGPDAPATFDATKLVYLSPNGYLGIGTITPSHNLEVNGTIGVTGGDYSIQVKGGSKWLTMSSNAGYGTPGMHLKLANDGGGSAHFVDGASERFVIDTAGRLLSTPTYANAGTGTALQIASNGMFFRSSSSIKYKKDVEPLEHDLVDRAVRQLQPVWYRTKNPSGDDKAEWSHIGLIAEDVAKVEKRLVKYKTVDVIDGVVTPLETPVPEDVDYARLSVILLDYVQRLEKRVAALEARP